MGVLRSSWLSLSDTIYSANYRIAVKSQHLTGSSCPTATYRFVPALLAGAALATSTGNSVPAQESANRAADLTLLKSFPDDALMAIVTPSIGNLDAKLSTVSGLLKMPTPGLLRS